MSAESGVPTYRGRGGIWNQYKWENYACQTAFERDPEGVLEFHELRRIEALKCQPHGGHTIITDVQNDNSDTIVITQNIDGMHQRAKSKNVIELHGSLWRMWCESEKILKEDLDRGKYKTRNCDCGNWLRPDIIWFQDMLNDKTVLAATQAMASCDLFVSIGTSAVVWPAAGYPKLAKNSGAFCVEINPEATELSGLYDQTIRMPASAGLEHLFK